MPRFKLTNLISPPPPGQWGTAGEPVVADRPEIAADDASTGGFGRAFRVAELMRGGLSREQARLQVRVERDPGLALIGGVIYQRLGPLVGGFYQTGPSPASLHAGYVTFDPIYGNIAPEYLWRPPQEAWARSQEPGGVAGFWSDWGVAIVGLGFGAAVAGASAAGAIGTVGEVAVVPAVEGVTAPAVAATASEFSLAGAGQGVGIGGQTYGLGLSAEAAGIGLQVPAGSAALLAPALTYPLTYAAPAGALASQVAGTVQTVKAAVSPFLAAGSALRSLLGGGDASRPGGTRPDTPPDTFALDLAWTVGALVAVFTAFKLARG